MMKINFFLAWFDLWIGAYWDVKKKILYICPLPCCVVKIQRKPKPLPPPTWRVIWGNFIGTPITIEETTQEAALNKALSHIANYVILVDHDDSQIWPRGMTGAAPLIAWVEKKNAT